MGKGSYGPTNHTWLFGSEESFDTADSPGGYVTAFKGAQALNIGDVVYVSAAFTVDKSTTQTNYNSFAGVVVGGKSTGMKVMQDDAAVGTPASAAANELVLVCVRGKAKCVADGIIAAGATIQPDGATAGRVESVAPSTVAHLLQRVGVALETTANAGDKFLALIQGKG